MIRCTKCDTILGDDFAGLAGEFSPCPNCASPLLVELFPAHGDAPEGPAPVARPTALEGEAGCFNHPKKAATRVCSSCGRFLCDLCAVEFKGDYICPVCLETGKRKQTIADLEFSRPRYDTLALSLAVVPVFIYIITIVTAPIALFVSIRYWRRPMSLVANSRRRMLGALLFSLLQIVLWAFWLLSEYPLRRW